MYDIRLTRDAQAFYQAADDPLVKKLNHCFDQLKHTPYRHPNVKRLKGSLVGYWRYRVGEWRVVYRIDENGQAVHYYPHRSSEQDLQINTPLFGES